MKKLFHKFLVPGHHNNFRPHLLTETAALVVIAVFIGILGLVQSGSTFVIKNENTLAIVYPAIVASLANEGRKNDNLSSLTYNKTLEEAARRKVNDMVTKGYFAHMSPDGKQPWDWIRAAGYNYEYAGENLAINYSDSIDVNSAWMNSPTHRANILNKNYTEVGIAVASTVVDGQTSVLVVQMFGKPKGGQVSGANTNQNRVENLAVENPIAATLSPARTSAITPTSTLSTAPVSTTPTPAPTSPVSTTTRVSGAKISNTPQSKTQIDAQKKPVAVSTVKTVKQDPEKVLGSNTESDFMGTTTTTTTEEEVIGVIQPENSETSENLLNSAVENLENLNISRSKALAWTAATSPNAVSMGIYILFIIIISFAVMALGFVQYHKHHKKSIFIAVILFVALSIITIVYIGSHPQVLII